MTRVSIDTLNKVARKFNRVYSKAKDGYTMTIAPHYLLEQSTLSELNAMNLHVRFECRYYFTDKKRNNKAGRGTYGSSIPYSELYADLCTWFFGGNSFIDFYLNRAKIAQKTSTEMSKAFADYFEAEAKYFEVQNKDYELSEYLKEFRDPYSKSSGGRQLATMHKNLKKFLSSERVRKLLGTTGTEDPINLQILSRAESEYAKIFGGVQGSVNSDSFQDAMDTLLDEISDADYQGSNKVYSAYVQRRKTVNDFNTAIGSLDKGYFVGRDKWKSVFDSVADENLYNYVKEVTGDFRHTYNYKRAKEMMSAKVRENARGRSVDAYNKAMGALQEQDDIQAFLAQKDNMFDKSSLSGTNNRLDTMFGFLIQEINTNQNTKGHLTSAKGWEVLNEATTLNKREVRFSRLHTAMKEYSDFIRADIVDKTKTGKLPLGMYKMKPETRRRRAYAGLPEEPSFAATSALSNVEGLINNLVVNFVMHVDTKENTNGV